MDPLTIYFVARSHSTIFSYLWTTIPIRESLTAYLVNGATRYSHIKIGRNKSYFTSNPLNGDNKYTANDICRMIEFLVDNIYVRFGGQLF